MTYTDNLNLKKPEYGESADIAVINDNMDAIDNALTGADELIETITTTSAVTEITRTGYDLRQLFLYITFATAAAATTGSIYINGDKLVTTRSMVAAGVRYVTASAVLEHGRIKAYHTAPVLTLDTNVAVSTIAPAYYGYTGDAITGFGIVMDTIPVGTVIEVRGIPKARGDHYCSGADSVTLSDATALTRLIIAGSSVQSGTPTPEAPIAIGNVGNLVADGEHAGKYAIPITVSDSAVNPTQTTSVTVYLDEPLRSGDTLELVSGRLVRKRAGYVFDGAEPINMSVAYPGSVYLSWTLNPFVANSAVGKLNTPFLCSHATSVPNLAPFYTYGHTYSDGSCNLFVVSNGATTLPAAKSYLASQHTAGTPVTIDYVRATPTVSTITGVTIPLYGASTVITIGTTTPPASIAAAYEV